MCGPTIALPSCPLTRALTVSLGVVDIPCAMSSRRRFARRGERSWVEVSFVGNGDASPGVGGEGGGVCRPSLVTVSAMSRLGQLREACPGARSPQAGQAW